MMRPLMDLWSQIARETTAGFAWQTDAQPAHLLNPSRCLRDWERRWMDAMSDSLDVYLRSPQFLDWMRHQSDLAVKTKQQSDNVTKEFARNAGIPTANDISGLYERLHSFEDSIIRHLDTEMMERMREMREQIGRRPDESLGSKILSALESVESRLERLETSMEHLQAKSGRRTRRSGNAQPEPPSAKRPHPAIPRSPGPSLKKGATSDSPSGSTKRTSRPRS
jgi:hypothetical protein